VIDSRARLPFDPTMTDSPRLTQAKRVEQAERTERLAHALRENLHRRKARARALESGMGQDRARPNDDESAA
jgi:hypothetical protein